MSRPEIEWDKVRLELKDYGFECSAEDLASPDFCVQELGKLGYSISIMFTTLNEYLEKVKAIGKMRPDSATAKTILDEFADIGGFYSYQLKGRDIESWGAHSSPMLWRVDLTACVALWNVLRLRHQKKLN